VTPRRVAITGASGFLGGTLAAALRGDGVEVVTIGRGARSDVWWDPAAGRLDAGRLAGADAVIHLAGATIGRRWTRARKREIRESRTLGTRLLAQTIARLAPVPRVLVSASAIGYYGDRGDEWLTEESTPGDDFLAEVTREWERAADPARAAGVRVVHVRTGLVLSPSGGALPRLLPAFRLGLGGPLAHGRQWMSWIALGDLVRAFRVALDSGLLAGAVNVVSPSPVTNAEFTATLARVLRRPAFVPVPAFALRALFGEMADATLLASQRVRPARLLQAGFAFEHPTLDGALRHVLGR